MGQLKASEVRLLILFFATVLILVTFFGYEWYTRNLQKVTTEKQDLQSQRQTLIGMKSQQNEFNQKRVWLNQNQPIATDEFEAKENLDRILSVTGIEAAGLTLISSPPEKAPSTEQYYWAFERRVVVSGGIQNIVQWLTQLQSESSFRVVTHLHIFPKKKKEPENLTCEVTVEQRYATKEILAMSNVNLVSSSAPMGGVISATAVPTADPTPAAPPAEAGGGAAKPPKVGPEGTPPSTGETTKRPRPVARPPSFSRPPAGGNNGESTPPARPRVRLPGAGNTGETSLLSGSKRAEFASVDGRVIRGGPTPPPLMPGEAELIGGGSLGNDVSTGVELVPDAIDAETPLVAAPATVPVDSGFDANGPQPARPFDSISQNVIVGEAWDASSPGADGTPTSDVPITQTPGFETN